MAARTSLSQGPGVGRYRYAAPPAILPSVALDRPVARPAGEPFRGLPFVDLSRATERLPVSLSWAVGALFVLAMLGLRWATRSQYLFDLDSILYARALDNFDLRLVQPPLPGYYLYIQMGRAVRVALGDANLSLVFLSWVFGVLLLPATYALGRELFDHRTGLIAALLALTGPVFWYQSDIASPRIAEAFFAAAVVWLGVRLRRRGEGWTFWALPVALAIAGGVRQQLLLYLGPFVIWATWDVAWQKRLLAACAGGCLILVWAIPTLGATGGIDQYRAFSSAQWQTFVVNGTGVFYGRGLDEGFRRLLENVTRTTVYSTYACLAGPALMIAELRRRGLHGWSVREVPIQVLLVAIAPALLFFALIHVQQIGHVLAIAPLVSLVVARIVARRGSNGRVYGVAAIAVLANMLFVLFGPPRLIGQQMGTPTVAMIRGRDTFVADGIAAVRSGDPAATLVLTSPLSYGYLEMYAPGYSYYLMPGVFEPNHDRNESADQRVITSGGLPTPDGAPRRSSLVAHPPGEVPVPAGVRRLIAFSYETDLSIMVAEASGSQAADRSQRRFAAVDAIAGSVIRFWPGHVLLKGPQS